MPKKMPSSDRWSDISRQRISGTRSSRHITGRRTLRQYRCRSIGHVPSSGPPSLARSLLRYAGLHSSCFGHVFQQNSPTCCGTLARWAFRTRYSRLSLGQVPSSGPSRVTSLPASAFRNSSKASYTARPFLAIANVGRTSSTPSTFP